MVTTCFIALMELGWGPCLCLPLPRQNLGADLADSSPSLDSPDLSALECIEEEEPSEVPSPGWSL